MGTRNFSWIFDIRASGIELCFEYSTFGIRDSKYFLNIRYLGFGIRIYIFSDITIYDTYSHISSIVTGNDQDLCNQESLWSAHLHHMVKSNHLETQIILQSWKLTQDLSQDSSSDPHCWEIFHIKCFIVTHETLWESKLYRERKN